MEKKVIEIMAKVFAPSVVDESSSQSNCENWDSLRHLNLIVELEDEFDTEFEPEEIAEMKSFQAIVSILGTKI